MKKIIILSIMLTSSTNAVNISLLQSIANGTGFLISATRIGEYLYAKMMQNKAIETLRQAIALEKSTEKIQAIEAATNSAAFKDWACLEKISPSWKSILLLWAPLLVLESWLLSHDIQQFRKPKPNKQKTNN